MSKICPDDKVYNPLSNRCVSKTGKIGKKLLLQKKTEPLKKLPQKKQEEKIATKKTEKDCPKGTIYNPSSNRCVSKTGKIGKKLLLQKKTGPLKQLSEKTKHGEKKQKKTEKACPEGTIYNPASTRCVSKTGKIGKKLLLQKETEPLKKLPQKTKDGDNLLNISSWKTEKPKNKGSNPAKLYFDPEGQKYYGKTYKNYERMETENLASTLYKLAGINAVETMMAKDKKHFVLLQKWMDHLRLPQASDNPNIRKGFIVDAWFANWDAAMNDNIMMDKHGNPIRVDVGGSLDYRAMGGKKQTTSTPFGSKVGQLTSMRKIGRYVDFKNIPKQELKEQVAELRKLNDRKLHETIFENVLNKERAAHLYKILVERKEFILHHS